MSKDWFSDIADMHAKFGVEAWMADKIASGDQNLLEEYLKFRFRMHEEEHTETLDAAELRDAEEVVDGIIDNIVFLIGTLHVFGVDAHEAWDKVHLANMSKNPGVKEGRPNPFGLPDLIKPPGWEAPSHEGNHGYIGVMFSKE